MTIAKVILESDDPSPALVGGLTVRFFDTGGTFITSGVSNVSGEVDVDLPDADYHLYFFKQGVSINAGMPLLITIDVADTDVPPNTFKVIVHVHTLPEAIDPLQCRISGFIRGADGEPTKDGRIIMSATLETGVLGGNVISPQDSVSASPDENGFYEFNLLRNVNYCLYFHFLETLAQKEPPVLDARVPNLPALDIADFMFPVPIDASFSVNVLALIAGDLADDSVESAITFSDGSIREQGTQFTTFSSVSDDEAVALVAMQSGKILITPVATGVANITIIRTIVSTIYYDPVPTFVTETLVVTVT